MAWPLFQRRLTQNCFEIKGLEPITICKEKTTNITHVKGVRNSNNKANDSMQTTVGSTNLLCKICFEILPSVIGAHEGNTPTHLSDERKKEWIMITKERMDMSG